MYKIAKDLFISLCQKYRKEQDKKDYTYYLNAVAEDGTALFDAPDMYQTNELIMLAFESSQKPLYLMTRLELETCISNQRAKLKYREPITEDEREYYLSDLNEIVYFRYNKYFLRTEAFEEKKLYTFVAFFRSVCEYYSGMDTICYVYLYRGEPIPIRIKFNGRNRNFKLTYDAVEKILHLDKVSNDEYTSLWSKLSQKLKRYYGISIHLSEYCWEGNPKELSEIPILQDYECYETFKTIEENGVIYDYSHNWIISVPKDLAEFIIPEGIRSIPEKCFMGSKTIRKVKFPSTIHQIPTAAFMDCEALEEVDLSSVMPSICSTRMSVGSAAFCNCKSLRTIDLSKLKLENESELTFAYCLEIDDISDLELSGPKAKMNFFHCEKLVKSVHDSYAQYGDFDLAYCNNIHEITIAGHTIPAGLLCGCEKLQTIEFTDFKSWRKEFGNYCFAGCKSLVEIDTLKGGAQIGEFAFADCEELTRFVINANDEWRTEISDTAFEGSPQVKIEWASESNYAQIESIADYWARKGYEIDSKQQRERKNAIKAKDYLIRINNEYASDKKAIGRLFKERGRFIGMEILAILKYDVCSWKEYLLIGKLFYECIPYSNMDDFGYIRSALVSWAKSCTIKSYLKAPVHHKYDAIQLIYNILKVSHYFYIKQKPLYGDFSRRYAEIDVLNTSFDYQTIEENATDEQKTFINEYTSLSDIRMSYLMQYYLLKHLLSYNTIQHNDNWDYSYANNEIRKIDEHVNRFGHIAPSFLKELGRTTWQQFIKNDIEEKYDEVGADLIHVESNEIEYITFNFSTMSICLRKETIID
jgi:hypothetical protein